MARTVNEAEQALRRDAFLDVAQRLVQTRGYEQMSIQDVLTELGTSKGAFYHYFASKQALPGAVIERMTTALAAHLAPIAADSALSALDKLQRFFAALASWKTQRRDLLLALLRVWYSDDNAVVRQKLRPTIAARIAPLLAAIARQGVDEGTFTVAFPDQCGRVVVSLIQDLNDTLADQFLDFETGDGAPPALEQTVAAYTDALERVLGLPSGALVVVDPAMLRDWFHPESAVGNGES